MAGGYFGTLGRNISQGAKDIGGGISTGFKNMTGGLAKMDPMAATTPRLNAEDFIKPVTVENPFIEELKKALPQTMAPDFTGAGKVGESQAGFAGGLEKLFGTGSAGLTDLISTLQRQQSGDFGPGGSLAQKVLEQGLGQNIAGVRSQLASQRGLNPALAARYAAEQTAQLGGQTAQQAGILGLQQQLGAQQLLGSLTGTAAGLGSKAGDIYGKMRDQEIQQATATSDAALKRLNILASSSSGIQQIQAQTGMKENEIRATIAAANQAAAAGDMNRRNQLLSGLLGSAAQVGAAAASSGTKAYAGGRIGGKAPLPGDHPKNDVVDAKLSPGEIVIPRSAAGSREAAKSFIDSLDDFDDEPSYGKVLKARQKKNYADGGVVEPDLDKEILDKYRSQQLRQSYEAPVPGVERFKQGLDTMLTENIVEPLARRGYPNLGAGIATVPSTLAEALLPSSMAEMQAVIPFPGAKLSKAAKEVLKEQGTKIPDAKKVVSNTPNFLVDIPFEKSEEWIESPALKNLIDIRLDVDPEQGKKFLKEMATKKSDEPYTGDFHNAVWRTVPGLKEMGFDQPMPRQVENLKGVLGKEVPKGGSDPFMWMDTKYGVTRKLLEKNKDAPLTINTRSDLIAHDDYINLLNKSKHKINIHLLGDMDVDRLSRVMEPGAPSIRRRLDAAKKLQEAGFDVTIVKDVLQNKNIPPKLQQMLFKSQPGDGFKVKQNVVQVPDDVVEKIKKLIGDFE